MTTTTTITSLDDLGKKQLADAIAFVTSGPAKAVANRAAGIKRLRREMGAQMVTDAEVLRHINGESAFCDGVVGTGDATWGSDPTTDDSQDHGEAEADVNQDAPVADVLTAEALDSDDVPEGFKRDQFGFVRRDLSKIRPKARASNESKASDTARNEHGIKVGSKTAQVFDLVTRNGGATTTEIREITPNIRQTCRGLRKSVKGFTFESTPEKGKGKREYRWTGRVATA